MKLPAKVIAKKPSARRNSLIDENLKNNNLNIVCPDVTEKPGLVLTSSNSSESTSPPAVICDQLNEQPSQCPLQKIANEENNNYIIVADEGIEQDVSAGVEQDVSEPDINGNSIVKGDNVEREPERVPLLRLNSQGGDDSGFNSSCSSDKDDEWQSSICDCTDNDDGHVCRNASEAPKSRSPRRVLSDSALALLHSNRKLKLASSSEESIDNDQTTQESSRQNNDITSPHGASIDRLPSARSARAHQRPQRHESVRSSTSSESVPVSPRRRRRSERPDHNNNETSSKSLRSYLCNAPLKMQDTFQDKGFLTFLSCVIYTLFLMAVFTVLGVFVSGCKSMIRQDELQDIKRDIMRARRRRAAVASG